MTRPEHGRHEPVSALSVGTRPARSSALPAWMSAIVIDRCHAAGTFAYGLLTSG